jgi:hypothetical protein
VPAPFRTRVSREIAVEAPQVASGHARNRGDPEIGDFVLCDELQRPLETRSLADRGQQVLIMADDLSSKTPRKKIDDNFLRVGTDCMLKVFIVLQR